jgi:hypothetical protein
VNLVLPMVPLRGSMSMYSSNSVKLAYERGYPHARQAPVDDRPAQSEPRVVPAPNGPGAVSAWGRRQICGEGVAMGIACSRY